MIRWFKAKWQWLVESDAPKAKAIRTLVQGFAFDVAGAVGAAVVAAVQSGEVNVTTTAGLVALVVLVAKTAVMTALAWAMAWWRLRRRPTPDELDPPAWVNSR